MVDCAESSAHKFVCHIFLHTTFSFAIVGLSPTISHHHPTHASLMPQFQPQSPTRPPEPCYRTCRHVPHCRLCVRTPGRRGPTSQPSYESPGAGPTRPHNDGPPQGPPSRQNRKPRGGVRYGPPVGAGPPTPPAPSPITRARPAGMPGFETAGRGSVSYTHLTLPTKA